MICFACRLYRKVYDLCSSTELQIAAALAAGKCCYEDGDYDNAITWLVKYIKLTTSQSGPEISAAYYLLGKSNQALGRSKQACEAFEYALAMQKGDGSHIDTVLTLAEAYIQQEKFIEAIKLLDDAGRWRVSNTQLTEIALVKAHVLRAMGLVEKAIFLLSEREQYVSDAQLKMKIALELARCRVTKGDLELAQKILSDAMSLSEPGPVSHQIAVELADVCLRLNQTSKVILICLQILEQQPSAHVRQRAIELLSAGYSHQKKYEEAALALMGKWNAAKSKNGHTKVEGPLSFNVGPN